MKKLSFLLLLLTGLTPFASARALNDVELAPTKTVGKQELQLNGAGLRTATVLSVKIYVAAFYAPNRLTSPDQVVPAAGPLRLDLTYLRTFPREKVLEAWNWQFEQSVIATYPGYADDKKKFVEAFGAIKKGGVETIELEADETRLYDDGVLKTTVKSADFQKAFISMWFGDKPVMKELKKALLAG